MKKPDQKHTTREEETRESYSGEERQRRTKPGSTRKFLMSVAVIAALLALIGVGFFSGIHYQKMFLSDDGTQPTNKTNEMYFQEGESFQEDEDYGEALESYSQISESFESYDKVKENMGICRSYYSVTVLTEAQKLLKEGKTEDALEVLCTSLQILGDNEDIKNGIKQIARAKDKKKVDLDLPEGMESYQSKE